MAGLPRMKKCTKCGETKPLTEFHKDRSRPDGLHHSCKECANTYWRERYKEPEVQERLKQYQRDLHKAHPERHRGRDLRYRYGITIADYDRMVKNQKYKCRICKEKKKLVVDHNHTTGRVRGLLCFKCNAAIHILENPPMLASAQSYLAEYA